MAQHSKQIDLINIKPFDYSMHEALNTLKANMFFSDSDARVISFFSTLQGEGTSTVTFNMARKIAEEGKNVIYVDADLRTPDYIGKYRNLSQETLFGLTHYLSGQVDLSEVLYTTNIPKLNVMTSGPVTPAPVDLINDTRFKEMLDTLRLNFDYVLIDCPPLGNVIDAALISSYCDGAILVIEAGEIGRKQLIDVKKQIEVSGCRVLGTVLNKVSLR